MSKRVLSFGGGVQTTAMAILMAQGKIQADEVIFADTGAEKPETYWYMGKYTKPLFEELNIPFTTVQMEGGTLLDYCNRYRIIPSVVMRWCTDKSKIRPMNKYLNGETRLVGFSTDEVERATRSKSTVNEYPLLELGYSYNDCEKTIMDYGWPMPLRSSCFFCTFQPWLEWNWLKREHPELIAKCIEMENTYYTRRPETRLRVGLFGGKPLWMWVEGIQSEWEFPGEYSCYSGDCGH